MATQATTAAGRSIARLHARAAETLARRATQQHVEFAGIQPDALKHGLGGELPDVRRCARSSGEIAEIGLHRVSVSVGGKPNVVAGLTETEGTPARTGEQADGRWSERNCGSILVRLVNHDDRCFTQSTASRKSRWPNSGVAGPLQFRVAAGVHRRDHDAVESTPFTAGQPDAGLHPDR